MRACLIGLTGPAGCGKNTVGGMIAESLRGHGPILDGPMSSPEVHQMSFAALLKQSAARLFIPNATVEEGIIFCDRIKRPGYRVEIYSDGEMVAGCSGRELLQRHGTESHRDVFGFDFWVDQLMRTIDHLGEVDDSVLVITDVRFENEAHTILDRGGEVWRIDREAGSVEPHSSEAGLPDELITRVIDNSGSLESLRAQVRDLAPCAWYGVDSLKELPF